MINSSDQLDSRRIGTDVHHLFDNPLLGIALMAVLVLFAGSVILAIVASFTPTLAGAKNTNLTYVATVVAGLVLSVASGVLGAPAKVQGAQTTTANVQPAGPDSSTVPVEVRILAQQAADFKNLYAWCYVLLGLACIVVFMAPTPITHDLVKSVGLTMLGFLITLVSQINNPPPPTLIAR